MKKVFWTIVLLISISALFGFVGEVKAEEFLTCRCWHGTIGDCSSPEETAWYLGQTNYINHMGTGGIYNEILTFSSEADCKGSILSSLKKGEADGKVCAVSCHLRTCTGDKSEKPDKWNCKAYTSMNWSEFPADQNFTIGDTVGPLELEVNGAANVEIGADKVAGLELTDHGGGSATLNWDTTKYSFTFLKPVSFDVWAVDKDNPSSQLSHTIHLTPELDCAKLISDLGVDCTDAANLDACKTKCEAIGTNFCVFKGGACVKAGSVTPSNVAKPVDWDKYFEGQYPRPEGYAGALPDCAFPGNCRDINDLLQLIVNFGKAMFAIVGSFAFAFFVYGGFTILTSMGNAERVKKGRDIIVAATLGLVIALSAYLVIDFMLDALKVGTAFRAIK